MKGLQWLVDYCLITSFVWGMYSIFMVPFMIFWVQLDWNEFWNWLIGGTVIDMIATYPITKVAIKYGPGITSWVKRNVNSM